MKFTIDAGCFLCAKFEELISKVNFEDVLTQIIKHYGDKEIFEYRRLYEKLKEIAPNGNVNQSKLIIKVFVETDEESFLTNDFDENDSKLNFDVSIKQEDEDILYSLPGFCYADFLGFTIDEKTLNRLSHTSILAHNLWEITAYSFEDNI